MPIYEYQCNKCNHNCEKLESINAPKVQKCPECGAESLQRIVSSTSFQLKGEGWYVTDFRDSGKKGSDKAKGGDS